MKTNGKTRQDKARKARPETMLDVIERRLPKRDFLTVSELASACYISVGLVYAWIDSGLVEAAQLGVTKGSYTIHRAGVIEFYRGRLNRG